MKKKIALLLSLIILVTLAIPAGVFGEGLDTGLENAIKTARIRFNIPDGYKFESSIESNSYTGNMIKIYRMTWTNLGTEGDSFNVAIDEKGTTINYNHYTPSDYTENKKLPKYSKSEAKVFADKFLKIAAPELVSKLRYEESYGSSTLSDFAYYLSYTRIENGVPLYNDQASININRNTGEVISYSLNWTDKLTFSDPSKAISAAKAQEAYISKLGLRMIYKYSYENSKLRIYPVYITKYNDNFAIDAITGLKLEINNSNFGPYFSDSTAEKANLRAAAGMMDSVTLTPEEQDAVKNAEKIISAEKAESIARSSKYTGLSNFKLSYSNLSKNWPVNDSYNWYMSFNRAASKGVAAAYASVTVDAVSGKILNFYTEQKYVEGAVGKVKVADAKAAANKFLKEFKPDIYNQLVYDDVYNIDYSKQTSNPATYTFNYIRKAGSILFPDNAVSVSYDAVNSKVVSFSMNWFNVSFPSTVNAIKPAEAYKTLFDSIGLELQYKLTSVENAASSKIALPNPQSTNLKAVLVYALKPGKPVFIDVDTAGLLDYDGKPYTENRPANYTDISGNKAENEIRILAEYGISLGGTEFRPAEAIIQKDFMIMLAEATGYYDSALALNPADKNIDSMYNYLIKSGIIKTTEKSLNAKVNREDAIKFIIRTMKYDKIADLKDMFNCTFTDKSTITPELIGYVTLAGNLKLIEYGTINFAPKTEMTRADTAVLIYKFLQQ